MPGSGTVRAWAVGVTAVAALVGLALVSLPAEEPPPTPMSGAPPPAPVSRSDPPSAASAVPPAARAQAVEVLLHERAEAIRLRDEDAFMASVDPKSAPEFQRAQLAMFRNLAEVPLATWHYEVNLADALPVPPPAEADETWAPRVDLSYALDGVDAVPTRRSMGYTFARYGDRWYLTDDDLAARGRPTWRGPWDFGECRVIKTGSGLIIGHVGNHALAERVASVLDESTAAVTDVWGPDWSRRVAVLLPSSREEMRAMVGPQFTVDGIAAVAVADRVDAAADQVEGPRVVLSPDTASQLSDPALRVVLQHEITHIAARADTIDGAPMWMLEGFADYVGYRGSAQSPEQIAPELARQVRVEGPPLALPTNEAFRQSGRSLDLAYQQAWSVVDFLTRRLGEDRVVDLYHRVAEANSPQGVEIALREVAGMSMGEMTAEWRADLQESLN